MTPFPVPLPPPANEDQRLYMQAFRCLMAASWQRAIAWSIIRNSEAIAPSECSNAHGALTYADELIEGAGVYLQLRADLREQAVSA